MRTIRAYDGVDHPVSDAQAAKLDAAFGKAWPSADEADALRKGLLSLAQQRYDRGEDPLTEDERQKLRACDDVCNMNKALLLMRGRDYREIFGPDGTLDQVHHNRVHAPCGCVVNFILDHNKRNEENPGRHPHYSMKSCATHASIARDFKAHFAAVDGG